MTAVILIYGIALALCLYVAVSVPIELGAVVVTDIIEVRFMKVRMVFVSRGGSPSCSSRSVALGVEGGRRIGFYLSVILIALIVPGSLGIEDASSDETPSVKLSSTFMYERDIAENDGVQPSGSEVVTHAVIYLDDDGTGLGIDQLGVAEGEVFILPDHPGSRDGYFFVGWSHGSRTYQSGTEIVMEGSDIVLTAVWGRGDYSIAYDLAGGDWNHSVVGTVEGGHLFTLPSDIPTRKGYVFGGWLCDGITYSADAGFIVSSDMAFTAEWIAPSVPSVEEAVESDHGESWFGGEGGYTLLLAIIIVIIAELAVLCSSKKV